MCCLFQILMDNLTSKDNQGFISKVSPLNCSIIELNWVTGLNAPKGMTIINNTNNTLLYVSDITDLVEIDVKSGKIINRYNAPGSAFLNDVVSDNQGHIYVSDTVANTIYRLDTKNLGITIAPIIIIIHLYKCGCKLQN